METNFFSVCWKASQAVGDALRLRIAAGDTPRLERNLGESS